MSAPSSSADIELARAWLVANGYDDMLDDSEAESFALIFDQVRRQTRAEVIAWLRDEKAMGEYDGLAECIYDTAVFPEDLANALERAWPSSSKGPGEST